MTNDEFLWDKETTRVARAGAIRQINIMPFKREWTMGPDGSSERVTGEATSYEVRAYFNNFNPEIADGMDFFLFGSFDTIEEAREFVKKLVRQAQEP